MNKRTLFVLAGVVPLIGLLSGCSSGRYDVSGTVTWQGKPVPIGLVVIEPDPDKGNTGPQTQGLIQDGHYQTASGRGAVPGPVIVSVHGQDGIPVPNMPAGKLLFREYQFRTELPARSSTLDIEVPPDHIPPPYEPDILP